MARRRQRDDVPTGLERLHRARGLGLPLSKDAGAEQLSPRELEALGLMAEGPLEDGDRGRAYAHRRAVEKHITNILMKLRSPPSESDHRRVLAVLAYLQGREEGE